jgi:hypothetical protein
LELEPEPQVQRVMISDHDIMGTNNVNKMKSSKKVQIIQ